MSSNDQSPHISMIEQILNHGGTIRIPYKQNISGWFEPSGVELSKRRDGEYVVRGPHGDRDQFNTLDEAIGELCLRLDNTGAIQEYVRMKNESIEELDWNDIKRLVKNEKQKRHRDKKKISLVIKR